MMGEGEYVFGLKQSNCLPDGNERIVLPYGKNAAVQGIRITNTSKTEQIVMLKHFAEKLELKI